MGSQIPIRQLYRLFWEPEVVGSNPTTQTNKNKRLQRAVCNLF